MRIVIIGAGGMGAVYFDVIDDAKTHKIVGFIDDDPKKKYAKYYGLPILGTLLDLPKLIEKHRIEGCIVSIGDNKIRGKLSRKAKKMGLALVNAIHPNSMISEYTTIGKGVLIEAGVGINPDTVIGDNAMISLNTSIGHGCILKESVHISPNAALGSAVTVNENVHIGLGATVNQSLCIGKNSIVGAGAAVIENVPENVVVVGVPARVIKYKNRKTL